MTTNFLPVQADINAVATALQQAAMDVGSGGGTGATYLKVDDRTGALTYGQERTPLPPGSRFAVGIDTFAHGYIDMQGAKVEERNVVPMHLQSTRPVPAKGYGTYEAGGARDITEFTLSSIDERGFNIVFTAWGVSSANRVRNLIQETVRHISEPDGAAGFVHPVIVPKTSMFTLSQRTDKETNRVIPARDLHHFDYDIVDWLHRDGKTLLSAREATPAVPAGAAPWDDEAMTDEERELLKAS